MWRLEPPDLAKS